MAPVSWSDLPEELLEMILRQATDVVNLYRYRNVCRSWRSVVDKLLASSSPHILLYEKQNDTIECIRLFNIFTGDSSVCKIPEFKTGDGQPLFPRSVYSCHGWLAIDCITSDRDYRAHHIFLYNPLSGARIRLKKFTLDHPLYTQVLLPSKLTNPNSIALAIRDGRYGRSQLIFLKPGDEAWTPIDNHPMWVGDLISYKSGFCAIDENRNLIQFELSPVSRLKKIPTGYNIKSYCVHEYLVESLCGDLLAVHKFRQPQENRNFKVYKLDWERREWDEITSLGDQAIFLARDEPVCIRAGESTVYRRNCIYFIDNNAEDIRVYDMGNKTIRRFPHFFPCHRGVCYRWFTTQI